MATVPTPPPPQSTPDEEFSPPLPPEVSPEPVRLELAPVLPFTEEEQRLIDEGRAEHSGRTYTSEEIRELINRKRQLHLRDDDVVVVERVLERRT